MAKDQDKSVIKFALPVGSLNNRERGNTSELLKEAGFEVTGYSPGKEASKPRFDNDPEIAAFTDRPQNMPMALEGGVYDAAILGADWALEWLLAGISTERLEDLKYGKVRIVFAVRDESPSNSIRQLVESSAISPIRLRTEYLLIAQKAILGVAESLQYVNRKVRTERLQLALITRTSPRASNAQISIEESFGRTEVGAINGSGIDGIVESTQTGRSLKEAGLKDIGTVFISDAGLYASTSALKVPEKKQKLQQLADLLRGVVRAREFEYVTFNVPETGLQAVLNYLTSKRYAAKVPTVSVYGGNAVVATLLPKKDYPRAVAELQRTGADDIVRLQSSQIVSSAARK